MMKKYDYKDRVLYEISQVEPMLAAEIPMETIADAAEIMNISAKALAGYLVDAYRSNGRRVS